MSADSIGKEYVIFDLDVTGKSDFVRKSVVIADHAVVCDMNSDHQEVARADAGLPSAAAGAVQSDALAYDVGLADNQAADFALKFHVLRKSAKDSMLRYAVSPSERRKLFDDRVRCNFAAFTDHDVVFDYNVGPDERI
jgi:hypothetical protein